MSVFEPALVSYLLADTELNALIDGRVRPGRLASPETYPALVYQRVSTVRRTGYDGRLPLAEARFQFDAWGERQSDVNAVANALMTALLAHSGQMSGVTTIVPRLANEFDSYETETGLYRRMCEFVIWHSDEGNG